MNQQPSSKVEKNGGYYSATLTTTGNITVGMQTIMKLNFLISDLIFNQIAKEYRKKSK